MGVPSSRVQRQAVGTGLGMVDVRLAPHAYFPRNRLKARSGKLNDPSYHVTYPTSNVDGSKDASFLHMQLKPCFRTTERHPKLSMYGSSSIQEPPHPFRGAGPGWCWTDCRAAPGWSRLSLEVADPMSDVRWFDLQIPRDTGTHVDLEYWSHLVLGFTHLAWGVPLLAAGYTLRFWQGIGGSNRALLRSPT